MNAPSMDWPRALRLALLAFLLGLAATALGGSQLSFLWIAYTHGGL